VDVLDEGLAPGTRSVDVPEKLLGALREWLAPGSRSVDEPDAPPGPGDRSVDVLVMFRRPGHRSVDEPDERLGPVSGSVDVPERLLGVPRAFLVPGDRSVDVPGRFPGVVRTFLAPARRSVDVLDEHLGPVIGSVDGPDSLPPPVHRSVDGLRAHLGTLMSLAAALAAHAALSNEERNGVGEFPEPVLRQARKPEGDRAVPGKPRDGRLGLQGFL
jgi:hypothetical protein